MYESQFLCRATPEAWRQNGVLAQSLICAVRNRVSHFDQVTDLVRVTGNGRVLVLSALQALISFLGSAPRPFRKV